jgi:hypothetical protein
LNPESRMQDTTCSTYAWRYITLKWVFYCCILRVFMFKMFLNNQHNTPYQVVYTYTYSNMFRFFRHNIQGVYKKSWVAMYVGHTCIHLAFDTIHNLHNTSIIMCIRQTNRYILPDMVYFVVIYKHKKWMIRNCAWGYLLHYVICLWIRFQCWTAVNTVSNKFWGLPSGVADSVLLGYDAASSGV